jgi:hypothetical protein
VVFSCVFRSFMNQFCAEYCVASFFFYKAT